MKKIITASVLAAACVLMSGCDNKTTSSDNSSDTSVMELTIDERTAKVYSEISFPEMRKLETAEELYALVGVSEQSVSEFSVYTCPSGMSPDEFGILVAKDDAAAAEIKTVIENRIAYQEETFRDYPLAAEQVYKLDDYYVGVEGNVVAYAICAENSKAADILMG